MRTTRKLKIVSNNKVRANRENAKKSTGPRTVSGKKAKKPVFEFSESKEEVKKTDTSYDDLDAYQKKKERC